MAREAGGKQLRYEDLIGPPSTRLNIPKGLRGGTGREVQKRI